MMTDEEADQLLIEKRLDEAGIKWPGDIYDLSRDKKALGKAAPVLLQLLNEVRSPISKVHLVRVVSDAKVSPLPFLRMLQQLRPAIQAGDEQAAHLGWTLGEALRTRVYAPVFDDLVKIVEDHRFGTARQMVVHALARVPSRREDAIRTLLRVFYDEDLTLQTLNALAKLKATEAVEPIQLHLDSPKKHVRTAARKALAKIAPDLAKAAPPKKPNRKRLGPIPADFEGASPVLIEYLSDTRPPTNFDLHGVAPFLERLTTLVDGFESAEKETVDQLLDSMEVEEEAELEFPVASRSEKVRLRFKLFLCDEGAVDLAVFTVPALSQQIQEAMGDDA